MQVSFEHAANWPTQPVSREQLGQYVYGLLVGDRLTYVGRTNDPEDRINSHEQSGKTFNGVMVRMVHARHVDRVEGALIRHWKVEHELVNLNSGRGNGDKDQMYLEAFMTGDYSRVDVLADEDHLPIRPIGTGTMSEDTKARREANGANVKDRVVALIDGEDHGEFRSLHYAFVQLGLTPAFMSHNQVIPWRRKLKLTPDGVKSIEYNGKLYTFRLLRNAT